MKLLSSRGSQTKTLDLICDVNSAVNLGDFGKLRYFVFALKLLRKRTNAIICNYFCS